VEDLTKQLAQYENWEKESERYELKLVGNASFLYALKPEHQAAQQQH
jgi:hypothetical protein